MSPEEKSGKKKAAENFAEMFRAFGRAVSEVFDDPELKKKAKELTDSFADSAKTLANGFEDEDVKAKFRLITKQTLQQEETLPPMRLNTVARNIHQTILAIDAELRVAVDTQYRQWLVKAAYVLRTMEELIIRKPAYYSHKSGLGHIVSRHCYRHSHANKSLEGDRGEYT